MDKVIVQFLKLLSVSMGTNEDEMISQDINWSDLYQLAVNHHVVPMVFDALQKTQLLSKCPSELSKTWREKAIGKSINQMHRTMQLLEVYGQLTKAGVKALIVKGLVLREIYPDPYYRSSSDEDIYINKADFNLADRILLSNGYIREKCIDSSGNIKQEIIYRNFYGLIIEIHTDLFHREIKMFGVLNRYFKDAFKDAISFDVELITIYTLSHDKHLLFLVLHSMKHFMANGVGIRQLCDIVMYCNKYGKDIQWQLLWHQLAQQNYSDYFGSLLAIGIKYLGLDRSMIYVPRDYDFTGTHSEPLLMDIIAAGIYGKSNIDQIKSGSITLQAAIQDSKMQGARTTHYYIMKALFPSRQYMSAHYSYSKKSAVLLPVAWIHRCINNMIEIGKQGKAIKKMKNSVIIGKKRIRLLKEYHLIGVHEDTLSK